MEQRDLCIILDKNRFVRKVKMNPSLGYKEGEYLGRLWENDPEVEFIEVDEIDIISEDHLNEIVSGFEEIKAKHKFKETVKCSMDLIEYKDSLKKG